MFYWDEAHCLHFTYTTLVLFCEQLPQDRRLQVMHNVSHILTICSMTMPTLPSCSAVWSTLREVTVCAIVCHSVDECFHKTKNKFSSANLFSC